MNTPPPPDTAAPLSPEEIADLRDNWNVVASIVLTSEYAHRLLATLAAANARIAEVEAERDAHIQSWLAERASHGQTLARTESLERQHEIHVAALQEIGKGVEADQATIARLTAERDNALADADNDRSLAASRQREVARLSEELAQADAFVALNCDHHGQVWTRQVMGIAEREDMITRHRARHDTERREG